MKNILFLLFLPILVFSQTNERQQKEQVRSSGTYNPLPQSQPQQRPTYTPQNSEFSQKYSVREQNRNYNNRNNQSQVIIHDPYWNYGGWGWNRWNPRFGWNSYYPYYWYDNWGYRNPARVYIYNNGVKDTIKMTPLRGSVGLQYNSNDEVGAWVVLGKNTYFVVDFSKSNNRAIGVYYPLLTLDRVLPWQDRKLSDELNTNLISVGVGKKISKKMGVHMSLGVGSEERRFRYYDEMYVLSNNGQYTFPNYKKTVTTLKIGTLLDVSRQISIKLDYDINRGNTSYGLGLKF